MRTLESIRGIALALAPLALLGCNGSGGGGRPFDGGGDGGSMKDLATAGDGAGPVDLASGGGDLTWDSSVPHPPAGAVMCGMGTFGQAESSTACNTPSFIIDHWGMGGQPFPRACGAATVAAGSSYAVWCTQTTAYVFIHFVGLRPTGTLTCKNTTRLSLSAVYESGSGGGDTGNSALSGYYGRPGYDFDVQEPIDAYGWLTVGVTARRATYFLAPFFSLIPACGDMNSGYRTIVGGVTATWTP